MPIRKIMDLPKEYCKHKEHAPPTMLSLSPGIYEHECPACGLKQMFIVNGSELERGPIKGRNWLKPGRRTGDKLISELKDRLGLK